MMMVYILFIVGIYLLVKSANWIVEGASSLAKKIGVSNLVIGLTIVALGTSLPELVVNLFAALEGSGEVAFGNIIGSNIANVLLVLGVVAIVGNVRVKRETIWKEIPFALLAAGVLFVLTSSLFGGNDLLTKSDGFILLGFFAIFLYYMFCTMKSGSKSFDVSAFVDGSSWKIFLKLLLGVVGIYFGGRWVVDGAVFIAGQFGLSEYLISATIIAVGTSLPELVVSVVAMMKKNIDLAVGNVIGSNVFNTFWVLGLVPLVRPIMIPEFVGFDVGIMFVATLLLFIFMFVGKRGELSRTEGIVFLLFYVLYVGYLIIRG